MLYAWNLCACRVSAGGCGGYGTNDSPVDVLLRTDGLSDGALLLIVDMGAKGELDEYTADIGIVVELLDDLHDSVHAGVFGKGDVFEGDANLLCSLGLHAHVYARVRACASLYDSKLGLETRVLCPEVLDALCDAIANGPGRD